MKNDEIVDSDEQILRCCRDAGLEIESAEQEGTVLLLHPSGNAELPDTQRLGELAAKLKNESIRFVTLCLDRYRQREET